jgi:hypothetical protein
MSIRTVSLAAALLTCILPAVSRADSERPNRSGPYSFELVDESGAALPTYQYQGRTYALGTIGQRYLVRVRNHSGRRVEAVVSVDGRDVIDGRPSAWEKRGYLVEAYGQVTIDGFRLNQGSVAAFRFSSVPRSYAARMGDARDVGVIGLAVFPERPRPQPLAAPPYPVPFRDRQSAEAESDRLSSTESAPATSGASKDKMAPDSRRAQRPGLGTEFGEEHDSRVTEVPFERATVRPEAVLAMRYDDRAGLLALGIDVDGRRWMSSDESWMRETASPFRRNSFAEPPPGWRR